MSTAQARVPETPRGRGAHGLRGRFTSLSAEWQVRVALTLGLTGVNLLGIFGVVLLALFVVPLPDLAQQPDVRRANLVLAAVTILIAAIVGIAQAWKVLHPVVVYLRPGAEPDETVRRAVLDAPRRLFIGQAVLWVLASLVYFTFNLRYDALFAVGVFLIVGLAGWTTSCLVYLVAERALRPVARRVLDAGIPSRRFVRSVTSRAMFAWSLGTGASVLGILAVGLSTLAYPDYASVRQLAITMVVMATIVLVIGWTSSYVAAQASSEPIATLRQGLVRVEQGDLDVRLPIYDGTEIGLLQAGFNDMVHGLREREQIRELFGQHVGTDVARRALEVGVELGGEVRDVAVLFVDIIGSTTLAENQPPEQVVAVLNRFFAVVIDVVHAEDGFINKFEGDAALAIWGAPTDHPHPRTAALRAARVMADRLAREVPEVSAGVGVSGGPAVAGNVGAAERYEYTVIGDPVNEAARLTDEAKKVPARVAANAALLDHADPAEARHWRTIDPVVVRGRSEPTPLATPS